MNAFQFLSYLKRKSCHVSDHKAVNIIAAFGKFSFAGTHAIQMKWINNTITLPFIDWLVNRLKYGIQAYFYQKTMFAPTFNWIHVLVFDVHATYRVYIIPELSNHIPPWWISCYCYWPIFVFCSCHTHVSCVFPDDLGTRKRILHELPRKMNGMI